MTVGRFEKLELYRSFEQRAVDEARKAHDPQIRESWELAASSWRHLAEMLSERCFCGRLAVGAKYYEGGARVPYCGEHLTEAICHELKGRIGLKPDN